MRLANEQASLRRVATLVAEGAAPTSVLAVVAEEVARVVNVWGVSIVRYEADGTATELANYTEQGQLLAIGTRWFLDGVSVVGDVRERPAGSHRRLVQLEGVIPEDRSSPRDPFVRRGSHHRRGAAVGGDGGWIACARVASSNDRGAPNRLRS